jgi:cytoskeletal protein RodZ
MRNNRLNLKKMIVAAAVLLVFAIGTRYFMAGGPGADSVPTAGPNAPAGLNTDSPPGGPTVQTETHSSSRAASAETLSAPATSEAALASSAAANTSGVGIAPAGPRGARPVDSAAKSGVITGNGVNIRSESRVDANNANVVVKVNKGERVQVIGAEKPVNDNKTWYNIKLKNGKTGFVREDLVKVE